MTTIHAPENCRKEQQTTDRTLQVKMFIHKDPKEVEKTIAHWLTQNEVRVHHIAQSQSEKGGQFIFVVTLFYTA